MKDRKDYGGTLGSSCQMSSMIKKKNRISIISWGSEKDILGSNISHITWESYLGSFKPVNYLEKME